MFDPKTDLDKDPQSGFKDADFDAVISDAKWLKGYFNGDPDHEQVCGVTVGKTYHVHKIRAYGDVADYMFVNDNGKEMSLGSFFFKVIDPEDDKAGTGSGEAVPGPVQYEWAVFGVHKVSPMWRVLWSGPCGSDGDLLAARIVATALGRLCEDGKLNGRNGANEIQPYDKVVLEKTDSRSAFVTGYDEGEVPSGGNPRQISVNGPDGGPVLEFDNMCY